MAPQLISSPGQADQNAIFEMSTSTSQTTSADAFIWRWQESLLVIPLGLIVIGTILGNFLVLYAAFTRSHSLRLPTHFIIANLSLADFLVGVLVMPYLAVLQVTGRWYFGAVFCEAWTVIHFWLCSASILSTCAVCIERYIGVRYPLQHKSIMNSKRIWGLISCVWTLAGLLAFGSLYIWPEPKTGIPYVCEINQQIGHVLLAVVGILYVPAAIMIVLYVRIFLIAKRHLKFMKKNSSVGIGSEATVRQHKRFGSFFRKGFFSPAHPELTRIPEDLSTTEVSFSRSSQSEVDFHKPAKNGASTKINGTKKDSALSVSSSTTTASNGAPSSTSGSTAHLNAALVKNVQSNKQINLAKRLSLLVGILLATYMPFFTLYMFRAFYPGSVDDRVFMAFGWIRYFNSCINPFIYALAVPAYRKAMTEIVFNGFGKLRVKK